nr:hypothetical protein [Tanacetum cinerariifolium]
KKESGGNMQSTLTEWRCCSQSTHVLILQRMLTRMSSPFPLPIPIQDSDPQQEEIDVVIITNDVLSPRVQNDDSDEEVDDSDFDNPPVPLPPLEPPDEEFDFEIDFGDEISVVRSAIVKFECIDARIVLSDENDVLSYFMFAKEFSFLSAESEDTIFDPGISD